jgi:hypothetical protein
MAIWVRSIVRPAAGCSLAVDKILIYGIGEVDRLVMIGTSLIGEGAPP